MDLGLRDKVAVITGSSRGLGNASAVALAREGARVVLNGRTEETLREASDAIRAEGGAVHAVAADVSTEDGCNRLVQEAEQSFGQIDILVNNAGGGTRANLASTDHDWDAALDWMFWPSLRLTRLVTPSMRERKWGVIVMISSIYGRELGGSASYQVV